MIEHLRIASISQMEIDLARMFSERIHKCCEDLVHRCFEAELDSRCSTAIMATLFTHLSAEMTAICTDMTATEYLRICRTNFEAAKKEAES